MKCLLYIDPQSGSLFFQLILSGLLSVMIFFKQIIAYVKSVFSRNKSSK
jgi:hypothetical protein